MGIGQHLWLFSGKMMGTHFIQRIVVIAVVVTAATSRPVRADQIASNINGTDIGSWGITEGFWSGVPFTPSNPWLVDSVVAPVANSDLRSDAGVFFQVYSNNAGQPGAPLGSKMVTPIITEVLTNRTFSRVGAPAAITAGTLYWMVVGVDDPLSDANPIFRRTTFTPGDGPGAMGLTIWSSLNGGGTWSFQNASDRDQSIRMQINGSIIPEPSAPAWAGVATAWITTLRRRQKRSPPGRGETRMS